MKVAARKSSDSVLSETFRLLGTSQEVFRTRKSPSAMDAHARAVVVGVTRELLNLSFPEIQRAVARKSGGHSSRVSDWRAWCALDWRERFGWLQMVDARTGRFA